MKDLKAPFVMKMRFFSPSATNRAKNAANAAYIGRRSGVVVENEKAEEVVLGSPAAHVKYAHERPRSHGLFSADGQQVSLKAVQKELMEHKGVVWRPILSLREDDAKTLGMTTRKDWEDAVRASMPVAAAKMGIQESNLKWVAAYHMEKGHPHVHIIMWEKDPKRRLGKISPGERRDIYTAFRNPIYAGYRTELLQEKTAMRDLIRDMTKETVSAVRAVEKEINDYTKEINMYLKMGDTYQPSIAPQITTYPEEAKWLKKQLYELAEMMPGKGRVAYAYLSPEAKQKVDSITNQLLQKPPFKQRYDKYIDATVKTTTINTSNSTAINKAVEKAKNDLSKRMSNVLVKESARINKESRVKPESSRTKKTMNAPADLGRAVKDVWKSFWAALEQERMKAEAQGEYQKQRAAQRQGQQQQQKEQEQER